MSDQPQPTTPTEDRKIWTQALEKEIALNVIEPACIHILRNGGATSIDDLLFKLCDHLNARISKPQLKLWLPHMPTVGPFYGHGTLTLPSEPAPPAPASAPTTAPLDPYEHSVPELIHDNGPSPQDEDPGLTPEEVFPSEDTPSVNEENTQPREGGPRQILPGTVDNTPPLSHEQREAMPRTDLNSRIPGLQGPQAKPFATPPIPGADS